MDADLAFHPWGKVLPSANGELTMITAGELCKWLGEQPASAKVYVEVDGVCLVCGDAWIDVGREEEEGN